MSTNKKILMLLIGAISTSVIVCVAISRGFGRFSEEQWKSARSEQYLVNNPRARMVDDLVANYLKPTMSKEDVHKILGSPDLIYISGYRIGAYRRRWFTESEDELFINYDKNGYFESVTIRSD